MRKMTKADENAIVKVIRSWKGRRATWKALRSEISSSLLAGDSAWSRQSLQANEHINAAWAALRERLLARRGARAKSGMDESSELEQAETALAELQMKYDRLLLRHRVVINNASLLPGGTQLLADSLPDNTRSQSLPRGKPPRRIK